MGLMAKMLRLKAATLTTPAESAGPSVVMTGDADERVYTPEVWGEAGGRTMPPDDTLGILVPVGGDDRFGVIIGTHHYSDPWPELAKGEQVRGATDATGAVLKANTVWRSDGTQELNGDSKRFVTWDELNTALQSFMTALNSHTHPTAATGPPSPPTVSMSLDITAAKTTTLKTGG